MANFYLWAAFGLCLLKLCLTETQFNVSCRYGGVFHVEKNGRYSLTRTEAIELCRALNSTLATLEQFERAHELGFETCRYGFIVGHIVIPRINPYHLCAANHTGVYKLSSNTTGRYDAYCYNETESRIKACEPIERIDTSFLSNQSEIVIDNEDGSRYNADGTRHSGDSSTSGVDDENLGSGSIHDTTPGDTSIRRSSPSYYGSVTPISHMPDHSSGGGEKDFPVKQYDDEISPTSTDISATATDFHKEDDVQHPASTTPDPHRDNMEKTTTQSWWNPFLDQWWWSYLKEKTQEPTQATSADVSSSGNGSDDEDSSEEMMYSTVVPGWEISVAKNEYAPSTTPDPHHDILEKITTQAQWNPFLHQSWLSNPREKTQESTPATRADVSSSGNGSDDEDSSEEMMYSTVVPGWEISVAKNEYAPSTTPDPHRDNLEKTTTQSWWNLFSDQWLLSNPREKTQESTSATSAVDSKHEMLLEVSTQDYWKPSYTDEEERYPSSAGRAIITTVTDSNDVLNPEDVTREVWTPRVIDTALATPDNGHHEEATQATLPSDNEAAQSTEGITHTTDAPGDPVLLGLDPASTDEAGEESLLTSTTVTVSVNVFHPEEGTNRPLIPSIQPGSDSEQANATDGSHVNLIPGVFPDMDDHLYQLPTPPPPRSTSNINSDQGPYQEDGEPTPFPGESTTTTVTSQPRSAQVPEWLIIVAALLALALILAVCIAVNSRRRCGQKKKLVINNGKGAVEDRKTRELNGDASKSQEMVHLVHKEQSNDQTGACDEFLTVDETQNHQDVDMKSGV
ncbi:CD44 antigen isoform X20 [Coturnix japonica]|uniref:CD44 antigen isoform X20 n=1 Tax=Coturnix japonica TaxID=93934 RepID=UPI000777081F|nr:CD44 antigen isoform X20 [Coturnix japonica]